MYMICTNSLYWCTNNVHFKGGQFWSPMPVQLQNFITNSKKIQKHMKRLGLHANSNFSFKKNLLKNYFKKLCLPKIQFRPLGGWFLNLLPYLQPFICSRKMNSIDLPRSTTLNFWIFESRETDTMYKVFWALIVSSCVYLHRILTCRYCIAL